MSTLSCLASITAERDEYIHDATVICRTMLTKDCRGLTAVVVCQGNGQGVSHVGGFGYAGQSKLIFDGHLHLRLGGAAVAGERLLDLRGGIRTNLQLGMRGG